MELVCFNSYLHYGKKNTLAMSTLKIASDIHLEFHSPCNFSYLKIVLSFSV